MQEWAGLKIRLFGDPGLRKKAKPVKEITPALRELLKKMTYTMYEGEGIGLAAPQVGIDEAMIVADCGLGLYKLINPKIIKRQGSQTREEGCLSIPGICIKVRRAKKMRVEAQDEFGQPLKIEAEDLLACVLQHEIDHLKGKLIVDYASFWDKLKIARILRELKKQVKNEKTLSQSERKSCQL